MTHCTRSRPSRHRGCTVSDVLRDALAPTSAPPPLETCSRTLLYHLEQRFTGLAAFVLTSATREARGGDAGYVGLGGLARSRRGLQPATLKPLATIVSPSLHGCRPTPAPV